MKVNEAIKTQSMEERAILTIGILQGGGSIVGVDFEHMIGDKFGFQVGFGFVGLGASINYHFEPSIRSSFISLSYWNQGIGDSNTQKLIGPSFVFRGKKWFTFNIGLAYALSEGPAFPVGEIQSPIQLTYGIGVYFPL